MALLGLPVAPEAGDHQYASLAQCPIPKLFLSGSRDEFVPIDELEKVAATAAPPKRFILLEGADHFFSGRLEPMQSELAGWLKEQLQ